VICSLTFSNSKDERTGGRYALYACESSRMGLANSGILEDRTLDVLLAEDDLVNQRVMLLMLKKIGHKVDTASTGLEVLQSVEKSSYDVILMDIQMPEMDGIAATKEIIRLWPDRCPKIIAVTLISWLETEICASKQGWMIFFPSR
jgi:DNA-binding NtrC family response regulator